MNFQNKSDCKHSSTFEAKSFNSDIVTQHMNGIARRHPPLYGEDPNFYWKSNYYLTLKSSPLNFVLFSQFEDQIQLHCLREHKQVIGQVMRELQQSIQINQFSMHFLQQSLIHIQNSQFALLFFQQLVELEVFNKSQAFQFKQLISKRRDWKKICHQFLESISKFFYWEICYLFYVSIKLMLETKYTTKFRISQLQTLLQNYLARQEPFLREKLNYLKNSTNFHLDIKKILMAILLSINGIFINKDYNHKLKNIILEKQSIQDESSLSLRGRKIRLINSKWKSERSVFFSGKPYKKKNSICNSI